MKDKNRIKHEPKYSIKYTNCVTYRIGPIALCPDEWEHLLDELDTFMFRKVSQTPPIKDPPLNKVFFQWEGPQIVLSTECHPITGENPKHIFDPPKIGFAGMIDVEGNPSVIAYAAKYLANILPTICHTT